MDLNYFKDKLFDIINDSETLDISDIETDDKNNLFHITTTDGSIFEIECREINK